MQTTERNAFIDITAKVAAAVAESGVESGVCHVFTPHTTAGITVNEHADPDVAADMLAALSRLVPEHASYRHAEGNSDAHIKAGLMGSSQSVFIEKGRLALGTWQGIFFAEFDGPRRREVWVKILSV